MAYTYTTRHKAPTEQPRQAKAAQPAFAAPAHTPSAAEANLRPVDLPVAIQAKMEASLGADLSAVKLYESEAVAEHGAQAVAQGNRIAFAPGMLDFASTKGQALLGHELSHVVSQAKGEVTGGGFLNDAALEARADREGAMAAAGEQIYTGPVSAPLSAASPVSSVGPMQAKKESAEEKRARQADEQAERIIALQMGNTLFSNSRDLAVIQREKEFGILSDEENDELLGLQQNGVSDDVLRALARKRVDSQRMIASEHTFDTVLNRDREESMVRHARGYDAMRVSAVENFFRNLNMLDENPNGTERRAAMMSSETNNYLSELDPVDAQDFQKGAQITDDVAHFDFDQRHSDWYRRAQEDANFRVLQRNREALRDTKKGFWARLFGR